ncbi:MAG TPA: ABC transporter ATP-binding protein [Polyangiaceae bacterium]|nr:ABC transporter ATP-binding protein [Polyangiaceae bacterium]
MSETTPRGAAPQSVRALCAEGVRVHLGGRAVVDGVGLNAAGGQISAIVGPNGSGKTSLLRALAGLLPYEGRVTESGTDLSLLSTPERARRVAYLPQTSALRAMLSVREVVALGRYARQPGLFARTRQDDLQIREALRRTDISELSERAYPKLSGGQQRLVLIARALATGASTLLLDEPTASLDVRHALSLFALLESLAKDGYCIVLVLHDLDDVQRHADWAVLLDAGRVQAHGPPTATSFLAAAEQTYGVTLVPGDRLGFRTRRGVSKGDGAA